MAVHALSPNRMHQSTATPERELLLVEGRMKSLSSPDDLREDTAKQAAHYHLDSGGNRTRALLGLATAQALGVSTNDAVSLAASAELLHNASLIHDDLQDRSPERRGRLTVWRKYGESIAICAGDLLISAAFASLALCRDIAKLSDFVGAAHRATSVVIAGQSDDLLLQNRNLADFTVYKDVAAGKSGSLIALPIELALIAGGYDQHRRLAREAATHLAVAYQITDDLSDVQADAGEGSRPRCLNAVTVLEQSGSDNPLFDARLEAKQALEKAAEAAAKLPKGSGLPLLRCMDAITVKLEASNA